MFFIMIIIYIYIYAIHIMIQLWLGEGQGMQDHGCVQLCVAVQLLHLVTCTCSQ